MRAAFLLAATLCARTVLAADYHVSAIGNDADPGTLAQPWRTLAPINAASFVAGDRVLLEGGSTFSGTLSLGADDMGLALNPIIVTSYGTGRAVIDSGAAKGISIYNSGGVRIVGLVLRGGWNSATQSGSTESGIEVYMDLGGTTRLDHVQLVDVDVSGYQDSGITIGAWPADGSKSGFRDVLIERCDSHDNGDAGISSWGRFDAASLDYAHRDLVIRDCRAFRNRGIVGKGSNTGNGIVISDVYGALIEDSEAFENGELCDHPGGGPVGIWAWDASHVTIQHCESHHNRTSNASPDGGGFDLDGGVTDSLIQHCWAHDNDGAGILMWQFTGARPLLGRNVIRYNICQDDGRKHGYGGIHVGGGTEVRDNTFLGNTIFMSPGANAGNAAIRLEGIGSGNTIRNNVFLASGGAALMRSQQQYPVNSAHFQGNAWWADDPADFLIRWGLGNYLDLPGWRALTSQETLGGNDVGLDVDPLLRAPGTGGTIGDPALLSALDAYDPLPGSPLIDAGLDVMTLFGQDPGTADYHGAVLPQGAALDVGAIEAVPCLPPAGEVDLLKVFKPGGSILFTWTDRADATSYAVYQSPDLPGASWVEITTATSGTPGVSLPMPPEALLHFVVLARNGCGSGP